MLYILFVSLTSLMFLFDLVLQVYFKDIMHSLCATLSQTNVIPFEPSACMFTLPHYVASFNLAIERTTIRIVAHLYRE